MTSSHEVRSHHLFLEVEPSITTDEGKHVADLLESEAEEGNWTSSASYKAYTAPVSHTMAIGFPGPLVRPDRPFRICDSRRIDYTSRCPPGQGGLPSDSKEITMKPKLKWLAIVLAVSLLGFATALLLWPRDRITAESWQKIRIGMTEEEVTEILGGPGINVEDFWSEYWLKKKKQGLSLAGFSHEGAVVTEAATYWVGRSGLIGIEFDEDGRVTGKIFRTVESTRQSFLDPIRDWLGW